MLAKVPLSKRRDRTLGETAVQHMECCSPASMCFSQRNSTLCLA